MYSEFHERINSTALLMRVESDLAGRESFKRERRNSYAQQNHRLRVGNRSKLDVLRQKVIRQPLLRKGTLTNDGVLNDYWVGPGLCLTARVQYERWHFPQIPAIVSGTEPAELRNLFRHTVAKGLGPSLETGGRP